MSQFIEIKSALPLQSQAILKGILSKVIQPTLGPKDPLLKSSGFDKQLTFSNSQALLKTRTDKRFVEQAKLADQLQHIVMLKDYQSMKKKLDKYGRSKSSTVSTIMSTKKQPSYFEQQQELMGQLRQVSKSRNSFNPRLNIDMLAVIKKQQRLTKLRYSIGNIYSAKDANDRVVFVDRKYNREFAIKKSSLIQAEEIMLGKESYKQFLSRFRRKEPLVEEANATRSKFQSEYVKQPLQNKGIIEKAKQKFNHKLYRAKRVNLSSHEVLLTKDNSSSGTFIESGQFFNKKLPSPQGEKLMVHEEQEERGGEKENYNKGLKENKENKGSLMRKKFTLTFKEALNFHQLKKKNGLEGVRMKRK